MADYKDNDTAGLKLAAAVGGVVVVCFCLGYFVIGKGFSGEKKTASNNVGFVGGNSTSPTVVENTHSTPKGGRLTIIDNTAEVEAKRKKAAEEAKKKADEEEKKKADEEAKKLAALEASENQASPTPSPSMAAPDPDDLPDTPVESPAPEEDPVTEPVPSPSPTPTPRPVSTPKPVPSPSVVPNNTPDDPEDIAMANSTSGTTTAPPTGPLYRIRVGSFADRTGADTLAAELKSHGYATSLTTETEKGKTVYRLQVGAYRNEKTARDFARVIDKELEPNGFKATISHH